MTDAGVSDAPVQGFISYRRDDNEDFGGVVDELAKVLAGLFEARTGQKLNLFVDRESIGWGEDWRERIEDSVRKATLFIPIITIRYFSSQACMDELTAFEATARQLGVTDLILPIVLFGAEQISVDDERPEVQLIARLNYRSLEDAWEAGFQSPEWREFINKRAKELANAMTSAELALTTLADQDTAPDPGSPQDPAQDRQRESEEHDFDLSTWMTQIQEATQHLEEATDALVALGNKAEELDTDDLDALTPAQLNARLLAFARELSGPARDLEDKGNQAERSIRGVDPQLRAWIAELSSFDLAEAHEQRDAILDAIRAGGDMIEAEAQVSELTQTIQFVSLMNVGLRKSLKPAVNGLRSLLTAIRTYQGWQYLGP